MYDIYLISQCHLSLTFFYIVHFKGEGIDFLEEEAELKTGVPHVIVDTTTMDVNAIDRYLFDGHKIPSVEEVRVSLYSTVNLIHSVHCHDLLSRQALLAIYNLL